MEASEPCLPSILLDSWIYPLLPLLDPCPHPALLPTIINISLSLSPYLLDVKQVNINFILEKTSFVPSLPLQFIHPSKSSNFLDMFHLMPCQGLTLSVLANTSHNIVPGLSVLSCLPCPAWYCLPALGNLPGGSASGILENYLFLDSSF